MEGLEDGGGVQEIRRTPPTVGRVITIPYSDLLREDLDLSRELEAGFGPNSLGIVVVSGEGSIGLLRGVEKFDHTRGFKLSTYVHRWIRQITKKLVSLDMEIRRNTLQNGDGETLHSLVADRDIENLPWTILERMLMKEDVDKLLTSQLGPRERDIVRLHYGVGRQDGSVMLLESISHRYVDVEEQQSYSQNLP